MTPLFHTMGIRTLLASILVAGTWVPQVKFDPEESLELIKSNNISALYLVPTMYWALLWTGSLPQAWTVKRIAYAGAPMTPTLAENLNGALHPEVFVNHFGSTEIYTFTIGPDARSKPGCACRAGVFSRVRLVDPLDPGTVVPRGTQGQVAVSMASPEAFAGYRNRPDADARAIRDGWYLTSDLATEDDDGDLWVSGRVDDMIISGGEHLPPARGHRPCRYPAGSPAQSYRGRSASGPRPVAFAWPSAADGQPAPGVQKLGAVAVPLSTRFGPAELAYCVSDADPRLVIGDDSTSGHQGTSKPP